MITTTQTLPADFDGFCKNGNDYQLWLSTGMADFRKGMEHCGRQCLAEPACSEQCVIDRVGYSHECAQTFSALIFCSATNCAAPCMAAVTPTCEECLMSKGCYPDWKSRSGLQVPV